MQRRQSHCPLGHFTARFTVSPTPMPQEHTRFLWFLRVCDGFPEGRTVLLPLSQISLSHATLADLWKAGGYYSQRRAFILQARVPLFPLLAHHEGARLPPPGSPQTPPTGIFWLASPTPHQLPGGSSATHLWPLQPALCGASAKSVSFPGTNSSGEGFPAATSAEHPGAFHRFQQKGAGSDETTGAPASRRANGRGKVCHSPLGTSGLHLVAEVSVAAVLCMFSKSPELRQ